MTLLLFVYIHVFTIFNVFHCVIPFATSILIIIITMLSQYSNIIFFKIKKISSFIASLFTHIFVSVTILLHFFILVSLNFGPAICWLLLLLFTYSSILTSFMVCVCVCILYIWYSVLLSVICSFLFVPFFYIVRNKVRIYVSFVLNRRNWRQFFFFFSPIKVGLFLFQAGCINKVN